MAKTLEIGTTILCSRKRHKIATVIRPVTTAGAFLSTNDVEFEPGQERVPGEKMECTICNSPYIKQNKIFTDKGWFPDDPRLEPVSP